MRSMGVWVPPQWSSTGTPCRGAREGVVYEEEPGIAVYGSAFFLENRSSVLAVGCFLKMVERVSRSPFVPRGVVISAKNFVVIQIAL